MEPHKTIGVIGEVEVGTLNSCAFQVNLGAVVKMGESITDVYFVIPKMFLSSYEVFKDDFGIERYRTTRENWMINQKLHDAGIRKLIDMSLFSDDYNMIRLHGELKNGISIRWIVVPNLINDEFKVILSNSKNGNLSVEIANGVENFDDCIILRNEL